MFCSAMACICAAKFELVNNWSVQARPPTANATTTCSEENIYNHIVTVMVLVSVLALCW